MLYPQPPACRKSRLKREVWPLPSRPLRTNPGGGASGQLRCPDPVRHPGGGGLLGKLVWPLPAVCPRLQEVARELEPRLRFVKLDTEQEAAIAGRYGIRSIPTLMVFQRGRSWHSAAAPCPRACSRSGCSPSPPLSNENKMFHFCLIEDPSSLDSVSRHMI